MTLPYQRYVDKAILEEYDKLNLDEWKSQLDVCYYLGKKFKTSHKYVYFIIKNRYNHKTPKGYVTADKVDEKVAKFIRRHRRGYLKKIMGKIYYEKNKIKDIKKILGVK